MKKPCSEMFCLRNQDITGAKAFFHLFFMSNSGYFIKNQKQMLKFSKALPKEDYRSKKIVAKRIEKDSSKPSLYKVTYEYAYDNNLVQYDVSFDKPNGSTLIRNLDVQIFGK